MKNYSKLFGLTKPERTTEKSDRNIEIEQNRKTVDGGMIYSCGQRRWLNAATIGWILRCKNIANSRRKRNEQAR